MYPHSSAFDVRTILRLRLSSTFASTHLVPSVPETSNDADLILLIEYLIAYRHYHVESIRSHHICVDLQSCTAEVLGLFLGHADG